MAVGLRFVINSKLAAGVVCATLTVATAVAISDPPAHAAPRGNAAVFTLQALADRSAPGGQAPTTVMSKMSGSYGVLKLKGVTGIADMSLANDGSAAAMSTVTSAGVDLSWRKTPGAVSFDVSRDGVLVANTPGDSFRDTTRLAPGRHDYKIVPHLATADVNAVTWGLQVNIPTSFTESTSKQLAEAVQPMAARAGTSVGYDTFIPQKYIAAPPTGCTYSGSKYVYGGDDRGFQASGYPYRTSLYGRINWTNGGTLSTQKKVGTTHVYKASNHALVAQKTASASKLSLTKLAGGTSSAVTLRFSLSAGNPFCQKFPNAIQGVFTMHITRAGSWSITSGTHTQMPNHEVYIGDGRWTMAYERSYASLYCLINFACERANMTGFYGSYS